MASSQNQGSGGGSLLAYPVATGVAVVLLAALAYLAVTRLVFGRISIEAGTR